MDEIRELIEQSFLPQHQKQELLQYLNTHGADATLHTRLNDALLAAWKMIEQQYTDEWNAVMQECEQARAHYEQRKEEINRSLETQLRAPSITWGQRHAFLRQQYAEMDQIEDEYVMTLKETQQALQQRSAAATHQRQAASTQHTT